MTKCLAYCTLNWTRSFILFLSNQLLQYSVKEPYVQRRPKFVPLELIKPLLQTIKPQLNAKHMAKSSRGTTCDDKYIAEMAAEIGTRGRIQVY
jgi:hypothetical protein